MRRVVLLGLCCVVLVAAPVHPVASQAPGSDAGPSVPENKRTDQGLYVTASEAYTMWRAAPEAVTILDVRTPEEYVFVGHAEMAWNIPLALQTYQWNSGGKGLKMEMNPGFVEQAKEAFRPGDTLIVMCRSGSRSAMAVNLLTEAGFETVYNLIDGMEGDKVNDPESAFHGKRMKNGWKNSGLPWTYAVDRERMRVPGDR